MALFPLHHEFPCKDHVFQHGTSTGQLFSSARTFPCPAFDVLMKAAVTSSCTSGLKHSTTALGRDCRVKKSYMRSIPYCLSSRGKLCLVRASSESENINERLKLLDSYFGKLQGGDEKQPSISTGGQKAKLNAETELESLRVYLEKQQKEGGSAASKLKKADIKSNNNNNSPFQQLDDDEEDQGEDTLNFYTVSILAAINVGVCLFEAAAPVRNNEMGLLSLPLLYGAKINDLIVAGEWWRLVTPMFLVQDQHIGSVLPFLLYQKHT